MTTKKTNPEKFLVPGKGVALTSPQCHSCKHWRGDLTCKAFPEGVPQGILLNAIDHTKAVEGDNGIKYEAKS